MSENTLSEDENYEEDHDYDDEFDAPYTAANNSPSGHPRVVTDGTVKKYFSYVKSMRKQFLASSPLGHAQDVQPIDLVDFLISKAATIRPKTFINYKCGLLYWMGTLPETSDIHHARLVLQVGVPKHGFKGARPNTTASLYSCGSVRKRTFERRKFNRLIAELNKRSAPTGDVQTRKRPIELTLWLHAGLASGLRPVEWETAKWHDRTKGELLVKTAKRKADTYALPSLADLPPPEIVERIVHIDADDCVWVDQHMAAVRRHLLMGEPFSAYYNNNRVYLWSVCRDLFGEGKPAFTLYMMRGQFAANRKRRGIPREEVAADMGCAVKVTSTYYGNSIYGHRSAVTDKQGDANKQVDTNRMPQKPNTGSGFSFARQPSKAGKI